MKQVTLTFLAVAAALFTPCFSQDGTPSDDLKKQVRLELLRENQARLQAELTRHLESIEVLEAKSRQVQTAFAQVLQTPARKEIAGAGSFEACYQLWRTSKGAKGVLVDKARFDSMRTTVTTAKTSMLSLEGIADADRGAGAVARELAELERVVTGQDTVVRSMGAALGADQSTELGQSLESVFQERLDFESLEFAKRLASRLSEVEKKAQEKFLERSAELTRKLADARNANDLVKLSDALQQAQLELDNTQEVSAVRIAGLEQELLATLAHVNRVVQLDLEKRAAQRGAEESERQKETEEAKLLAKGKAAEVLLKQDAELGQMMRRISTPGIWKPQAARIAAAKGLYPNGAYDITQPHSLSYLQELGTLEPGRYGLYKLWALGADPDDSMRPGWDGYKEIGRFGRDTKKGNEEWQGAQSNHIVLKVKRLQEFLRENGEALVAVGVLAK